MGPWLLLLILKCAYRRKGMFVAPLFSLHKPHHSGSERENAACRITAVTFQAIKDVKGSMTLNVNIVTKACSQFLLPIGSAMFVCVCKYVSQIDEKKLFVNLM